MKKISIVSWSVMLILSSALATVVRAEDKQLEKRRALALENFVKSSRKSDGDYSTISLKNCRDELGIPFLTNEDMVRKVLDTFDTYYKNLEVVDYLIVYANKPGPSAGIECDFLIIHHQTKPEKVHRFATKEK